MDGQAGYGQFETGVGEQGGEDLARPGPGRDDYTGARHVCLGLDLRVGSADAGHLVAHIGLNRYGLGRLVQVDASIQALLKQGL